MEPLVPITFPTTFMTTDESVSGTDTAAQTDTPTGDGVQDAHGAALENFLEEKERFAQDTQGQVSSSEEDESTVVTQPTEKDIRHFSKKINEEVDKRMVMARGFIERDPEYMYILAAEDPDVADRLLKLDSSYKAKSAKELLQKREKEQDTSSVDPIKEQDERLSLLEQELREERINRLKEQHTDLTGDLEEKFMELYSDETMVKKFNTTELLGFARALVNKPKTDPSNDVALALLRQQEGAVPSVRGGSAIKSDVETSEEKRVRAAFGHTKDDEKLLPPNWQQLVGN